MSRPPLSQSPHPSPFGLPLPIELILEIVHFLSCVNDNTSLSWKKRNSHLKLLSLVSHSWRSVAQEALFRHVRLDLSRHSGDFLLAVKGDNGSFLARSVRSIAFYTNDEVNRYVWGTIIQEIVAACGKVAEVRLDDTSDETQTVMVPLVKTARRLSVTSKFFSPISGEPSDSDSEEGQHPNYSLSSLLLSACVFFPNSLPAPSHLPNLTLLHITGSGFPRDLQTRSRDELSAFVAALAPQLVSFHYDFYINGADQLSALVLPPPSAFVSLRHLRLTLWQRSAPGRPTPAEFAYIINLPNPLTTLWIHMADAQFKLLRNRLLDKSAFCLAELKSLNISHPDARYLALTNRAFDAQQVYEDAHAIEAFCKKHKTAFKYFGCEVEESRIVAASGHNVTYIEDVHRRYLYE